MLFFASATILATEPGTSPSQPADFSGAWRLDEPNSDTANTVTALLRHEAAHELPPQTQTQTPAPTPAASSTQGSGSHGAGGGMGHGGGMGGGGMGGGGGGHGRHGGGKAAAGTTTDSGSNVSYPLPSLLQIDSVLLVQQDQKTMQIRLDNGELLVTRLDGQARQSLNGDAMVRVQASGNGILITFEFADGSQLEQDWVRSANGHRLTVYGQWKIPALKQPISFKRSYVSVD